MPKVNTVRKFNQGVSYFKLQEYLEKHRETLTFAAGYIESFLKKEKRCTLGQVAFATRNYLEKHQKERIMEWRVSTTISNASRFGAFRGCGFQMKQAYGFVSTFAPTKKPNLRLVR